MPATIVKVDHADRKYAYYSTADGKSHKALIYPDDADELITKGLGIEITRGDWVIPHPAFKAMDQGLCERWFLHNIDAAILPLSILDVDEIRTKEHIGFPLPPPDPLVRPSIQIGVDVSQYLRILRRENLLTDASQIRFARDVCKHPWTGAGMLLQTIVKKLAKDQSPTAHTSRGNLIPELVFLAQRKGRSTSDFTEHTATQAIYCLSRFIRDSLENRFDVRGTAGRLKSMRETAAGIQLDDFVAVVVEGFNEERMNEERIFLICTALSCSYDDSRDRPKQPMERASEIFSCVGFIRDSHNNHDLLSLNKTTHQLFQLFRDFVRKRQIQGGMVNTFWSILAALVASCPPAEECPDLHREICSYLFEYLLRHRAPQHNPLCQLPAKALLRGLNGFSIFREKCIERSYSYSSSSSATSASTEWALSVCSIADLWKDKEGAEELATIILDSAVPLPRDPRFSITRHDCTWRRWAALTIVARGERNKLAEYFAERLRAEAARRKTTTIAELMTHLDLHIRRRCFNNILNLLYTVVIAAPCLDEEARDTIPEIISKLQTKVKDERFYMDHNDLDLISDVQSVPMLYGGALTKSALKM